MDYALLSRLSIQSTSDQEEYDMYAQISANAATGVAPEQAAVWSYPLEQGDREETIFNMVNAMRFAFTRADIWHSFHRNGSSL